ncbi:MAG: hypothetical protein P1U42_06425 [Phycisphaerales bacterium]|nr:hypothetical protein [Phycisphaerales bacterium]
MDNQNRRIRQHTRGLKLAIGTCIGFTAVLAGCVSYTNVPVPHSAPAFQSANHSASISVIAKALNEVVSKYPTAGEYTLNLPTGTSPESAQKIIDRLPAGAILPYEGMSDDIPVYHIGRIWIRASDAKVDVVYPFTFVDGTTQDQSVTVWVSGGVRSWRVYRLQHWTAGTVPTPPIYIPIYPEDEVQTDSEMIVDTEMSSNEQDVQEEIDSLPDTEPDTMESPAEVVEPVSNSNAPLYREVPVED